MNPELQIMFHVLLFAVCVVITLLRAIEWNQVLQSKGQKFDDDLDPHILIFVSLCFFIPLEIVFWVLYWIFV